MYRVDLVLRASVDDETLHEIRTVQAYAREDHAAHTFSQRVEAVFGASVQRSSRVNEAAV